MVHRRTSAVIGHRRGEQVLMGQKRGDMFMYLNHNSAISDLRFPWSTVTTLKTQNMSCVFFICKCVLADALCANCAYIWYSVRKPLFLTSYSSWISKKWCEIIVPFFSANQLVSQIFLNQMLILNDWPSLLHVIASYLEDPWNRWNYSENTN